MTEKRKAADLFIVDNSESEWKVREYLREWTGISTRFDIATGSFEIGGLLDLDGHWQRLDKIRILMGDQVTARTRKAFLRAIVDRAATTLDDSLERVKETNDFLDGVPAIVDALRTGKIECRAYTKDRFHAKAYITHSKLTIVGSSALVGSSNFTAPGLSENVELNVQLRREVELLQEWFERHWGEAEDISPEILNVIERHSRAYMPFEVYARALQEYFRNREISVGEWERMQSKLYRILDHYQKEGYQALVKVAGQYGGAFLCDGVGLGKTFVGLMLIERLIMHERKRVMLLVPKSGRKPVWEAAIRKYLPHLLGDFSNLVVFNHTDLTRGGDYQDRLDRMRELADVIIIDEAHHFRNPGVRGLEEWEAAPGRIRGEKGSKPSRYWRLFEIADRKAVYFLTATPVNNSLLDFQHMLELFTRRQPDYFKAAPLGVHSVPGHFRKMEKDLGAHVARHQAASSRGDEVPVDTNEVEAQTILSGDPLFRALVVQRSRAYVRASQKQHGGSEAIFPTRQDPHVAEYSVKKTYGRLLDLVEKAFNKKQPLFSLAMYYPLAYYKGKGGGETKEQFAFQENRQKQVVGLIRTLFLKRFESSARAFEMSCEALLLKLLAFMTKNSTTDSEKRRLERWKAQHGELIGLVQRHQLELFGEDEGEADEDIVTDEMLEDVRELQRKDYRVEDMLAETVLDMDQIADFLKELQKLKPAQDDKLQALIKLLKTDPVLKKHKVMIFSEFMATARYLRDQLESAGIKGVDEVDSTDKRDRGEVLKQFAPYYNGTSSGELEKRGLPESRVLIATDVLSEGLNLQDATRLINYDLHWNPVRLMQRIGRVDRRMNPEIESEILKDHPEEKAVRGKVAFWNFLPPAELNLLLSLYRTVTHKTLRISAVFGIEGRKLLTPEDKFEDLQDFIHAYEGDTTPLEQMHLDYQKLVQDFPDLPARLAALPGRVFSARKHPDPGVRSVFFCYAMPAPPGPGAVLEGAEPVWSLEDGKTRWYLYELETQRVVEDPAEINDRVRSEPQTPRHTSISRETLGQIRVRIEKHIKNTYLRQVQAPMGVKPELRAWMEMN